MATPLDKFLDKWITHSPNQAAAIRDLLKGTISADAAAIKFTSRVTSQKTPKKAESYLYGMWCLLTDLAINFPHQQEKVVDLIAAIRALPDYVIGNEAAVKWSELPAFDSAMTENVFNRDVEFPTEKQFKESISKISFAARIAARHLPNVDYTAEAMYDMASALEQPPTSAETVDKEAIRHLSATVPVSAQWIFHAGAMVYNTYDCPHPKMDRGIWDGQPGFTKPRWDFWKERGRWVAEMSKLPKETRDVARSMVERMEEIESATE